MAPSPSIAIPGVVVDERLAVITDEGQNASRAEELRERLDGTLVDLETLVIRAEQRASERRR